MLPQLPEPVRHPKVIRAAVSPSAVIVTAVGVGIGLAAQSVVLAVILGAGAWLGRMAVAVWSSRRRRRSRLKEVVIDPWAVPDPWRQFVRQAVSAQSRFDQAVAPWPPGPLRDRLTTLQPRLEAGVWEVWTVARQGAALSGWGVGNRPGDTQSLAELSSQLQRTQAERASLGPGGGASERRAVLDRTEEALAAQVHSRRKAQEAAQYAEDRLRVLTARLDEAVTSVLELGVAQSAGDSLTDDALGSVDALTEEITALRAGLSEATASLPAAVPSAGQPPPVLPES